MKTDIFTLIASSALVLFSCAKEKSLGGSLQKMVVTKAKRELVNEAFKLGRGLLGSLLKGRK